jgi:hypothetical protein
MSDPTFISTPTCIPRRRPDHPQLGGQGRRRGRQVRGWSRAGRRPSSPPSAQAPDSARPGGPVLSDYGTPLRGRINALSTTAFSNAWGSPTETSTARTNFAAVSYRSPNHDLFARDVGLTAAPSTAGRQVAGQTPALCSRFFVAAVARAMVFAMVAAGWRCRLAAAPRAGKRVRYPVQPRRRYGQPVVEPNEPSCRSQRQARGPVGWCEGGRMLVK